MVHLQSDLESSKAELEQKNLEIDDLVKSKSQLVEEIQDWVRRSNEDAQEKSVLKKEVTELQTQLTDLTKVSVAKYIFFPFLKLILTFFKLHFSFFRQVIVERNSLTKWQ